MFDHDAPGPISRNRMALVSYRHFANWDYSLTDADQQEILIKDPATETWEAISVLPDQGYQPPGRQQQQHLQQSYEQPQLQEEPQEQPHVAEEEANIDAGVSLDLLGEMDFSDPGEYV